MESTRRSLLKTLSWRAIATLVTGLLGAWLTDSWEAGVALGSADTTIKLVLYFLHERAWARVSVGYHAPETKQSSWTTPHTSTPTVVPSSVPPSQG